MPWNRSALALWHTVHGAYLLPAVAIGLVLLRYALARRPGSPAQPPRPLLASLAVLAALTPFVWTNFFNWHFGGYLNTYEFFHYYLGSKYADEVGYFDLYNAVLVADAETGLQYRPPDGGLRDLRTYGGVAVQDVLARSHVLRARFSDARWREFVGDVGFFKSRMAGPDWIEVLHDHGYNASPVWSMVVGGLTNRVSTSSSAGMMGLALLDIALLLGAAAAVAWAFGLWSGLLMLVFLVSCYMLAHVHLKGALLRTDFAVCVVLATCLLKKGKSPTAAGALVGYATLSRLFPAIFLFGPIVKLAWELRARGKEALSRKNPNVRILAGFAVTLVLFCGASLLWGGGVERWRDFARKIALHRTVYNHWNVGFTSIAIARFDPSGVSRREALLARPPEARRWPGPVFYDPADVKNRALPIHLVQLAAIALCVFAVRRLDLVQALAFGFVPGFFLVAPTYYYYLILLLPFLYFAAIERTLAGTLGLAYLFLSGLLGFTFYYRWDQYFPTTYGNSLLLLGLCLGMIATAWRPAEKAAPVASRQRGKRRRVASSPRRLV